jgi:hypothetical protein
MHPIEKKLNSYEKISAKNDAIKIKVLSLQNMSMI